MKALHSNPSTAKKTKTKTTKEGAVSRNLLSEYFFQKSVEVAGQVFGSSEFWLSPELPNNIVCKGPRNIQCDVILT
jgi:hypothetical protein